MDIKKFEKISGNIKYNEPMSAHTTFRIGGCADVFADVSSAEEIKSLIALCRENDYPYMVVGNGSNLLVSDKGIRGLVIRIGKNMSEIRAHGERIYADAGALMSAVAAACLEHELTGFEPMSGIPGTIGGGIFMNAGAYGGELSQGIENVTYLDDKGGVVTEKCENLDLGYRHSMFQSKDYVILSCVMKFEKGNRDEIKAAMADYRSRRNEKQPVNMPSAGSTFKRPEGYFAGKLIQDAGLQGYSIGGAQVSTLHAGFIVNTGDATASDVENLIKHIQQTVYEKFGVKLEPEVRLVGER